MKKIFPLILGMILWTNWAVAYPEMVRHGYMNCTACHVSPTGGGILTPYGRSLSQELLSYAKASTNFMMAPNPIDSTGRLSLGGQLRILQSHLNTSSFTRGRTIFMQGDLEGALNLQDGKWIFSGTLGKGDTSDPQGLDFLLSRRHYVNYRPTDQLSFRVGRFFQAFGIHTPDHIIATKRALGMDYEQETYNLEAAYIADNWDVFATANLGRIDRPSLGRGKGFALRTSTALLDKHRVGFSYAFNTSSTLTRNAFGPYAILGFSKKFFALVEVDFHQQKLSGQSGQFGLVNYLRVYYQLMKGWQVYVTQELNKPNLGNRTGEVEVYGVGTQFFPIPHVEVQLAYQKQAIAGGRLFDFAWALLHIYL